MERTDYADIFKKTDVIRLIRTARELERAQELGVKNLGMPIILFNREIKRRTGKYEVYDN